LDTAATSSGLVLLNSLVVPTDAFKGRLVRQIGI
jgi:hypothetical protein